MPWLPLPCSIHKSLLILLRYTVLSEQHELGLCMSLITPVYHWYLASTSTCSYCSAALSHERFCCIPRSCTPMKDSRNCQYV